MLAILLPRKREHHHDTAWSVSFLPIAIFCACFFLRSDRCIEYQGQGQGQGQSMHCAHLKSYSISLHCLTINLEPAHFFLGTHHVRQGFSIRCLFSNVPRTYAAYFSTARILFHPAYITAYPRNMMTTNHTYRDTCISRVEVLHELKSFANVWICV